MVILKNERLSYFNGDIYADPRREPSKRAVDEGKHRVERNGVWERKEAVLGSGRCASHGRNKHVRFSTAMQNVAILNNAIF